MAKKSKIAKAQKREALVAKYAEKRAALKAAGDYIGLAALPKFISSARTQPRFDWWSSTRLHAWIRYVTFELPSIGTQGSNSWCA